VTLYTECETELFVAINMLTDHKITPNGMQTLMDLVLGLPCKAFIARPYPTGFVSHNR